MSQVKETTNATKSEPTEKQCICPEDAPKPPKAARAKKRKPVDAADNQEGFLIRLVPTPGHDLSALRRPPAPRRPAPTPKAPQRAAATMLLSVGQQPAVALVPPLPVATTTPYLATAASPYLSLASGCPPLAVTAVANAAHGNNGCGGCHTGCSHGPCCVARGDYSSALNTLTIPPYAMPFFGDIYRNAAHAPPPGGGNINVVTKVTSDDRKRKRRDKKRRDSSSEDSSESYRSKRRRSEPRKDEVLPTPAPPPVAPYKPPPPPEVATPAPVVKPLSPPLYSPPPEDNMPVTPHSPGTYPPGSDAHDEHAHDEEDTEEEKTQGGSNKLACCVVLVVVGVCIIIAVVLALYPKLLFGDHATTVQGQGRVGRQGRPLNLFKGRSSEGSFGEHTTAQTSEKQTTTWSTEVGKLVGKVWKRA
ncbi:hypothetical protein MTO96_020918 [Rhipicephalus appendiculatus]